MWVGTRKRIRLVPVNNSTRNYLVVDKIEDLLLQAKSPSSLLRRIEVSALAQAAQQYSNWLDSLSPTVAKIG